MIGRKGGRRGGREEGRGIIIGTYISSFRKYVCMSSLYV